MRRRGRSRGAKTESCFDSFSAGNTHTKKTAWCVNKHAFQTRMAEPDDETHTLKLRRAKQKNTSAKTKTYLDQFLPRTRPTLSSRVAAAMEGDAG